MKSFVSILREKMMKQSELAKIIRRKYKAELEALNDTIKKQKGDKRKFRDEYYFNSNFNPYYRKYLFLSL